MAHAWKPSQNRGFFFGAKEDTPVNWDLNWKNRVAREAREQDQFARKVVDSLPAVTTRAGTSSTRAASSRTNTRAGTGMSTRGESPSRMSRSRADGQLHDSLPNLPKQVQTSKESREAKQALERAFVEFLEQERQRGRQYGDADFKNASIAFNRWTLKNPAKKTW